MEVNKSAKAQDYAKILFEVGEEQDNTTGILYELNGLLKMRVKDVNHLLSLPVIPKEVKVELIDSLEKFEINKSVLNFLKILVQRNDFRIIPEIVDEYKSLYQNKQGIEVVSIYTARPLSSNNLDLLVKELENKLNKLVVISSFIEEDLIGGIKIEYDGYEVDNTIKKHLNDFSNYLVRS